MATNNKARFIPLLSVILIIFAIAGFVPNMFNAMNGNETAVTTHNLGEKETLKYPLVAILDGKDDSGSINTVNVTLIDEDSGNTTVTGPLAEGSSADLAIEGESVTVEYISNSDSDTAQIRYTYPSDYKLSDIQKTALGALITFILIMLLILIVILMKGDS